MWGVQSDLASPFAHSGWVVFGEWGVLYQWFTQQSDLPSVAFWGQITDYRLGKIQSQKITVSSQQIILTDPLWSSPIPSSVISVLMQNLIPIFSMSYQLCVQCTLHCWKIRSCPNFRLLPFNVYTIVQKFEVKKIRLSLFFLKKCILLFSKDALHWSKVTVHYFMMLLKISKRLLKHW